MIDRPGHMDHVKRYMHAGKDGEGWGEIWWGGYEYVPLLWS
jgi:hypothetical protein